MSFSDHPWIPRFVFGTGGDIIDWTLTLPIRPWRISTPTVGGSRTSAGAVPGAYVVRRDYNLKVGLRLFETELASLDALIAWGQNAERVAWYPDQNQPGTFFYVYLESPKAGEDWEPRRSTEYPRAFEMEISLRLTTGGPWDLDYFANP